MGHKLTARIWSWEFVEDWDDCEAADKSLNQPIDNPAGDEGFFDWHGEDRHTESDSVDQEKSEQ